MSPALASATESVQRQLVLLHEWPAPVLWLVGALAIGVLGLTWWNVRHARRSRRLLLLGLRALVLLLLGLAFVEPTIQEERRAQGQGQLAVLVDSSRSMGLAHGEERRVDLVRRMLHDRMPFWESLASQAELRFYAFDESLRPLAREAVTPPGAGVADEISPLGDGTDIAAALAALDDQRRGQHLAGVLILSDGIDTASLRASGAEGEEALRALVERLDCPLFTYGLAGSPNLRDLSVESVRASDFAFLLNATEVEATLRVVGYEVEELEATLLVDGQPVARRSVPVPPGAARADVSFPIVPAELGKHVWSVSVAARDDEVTTRNNTRSVVVRVLRDRVRVLQIAGHPSWDVRFLRNLLERNPNVDLISFFILVNPTNLMGVGAAETTLIPFPAQELFVEELGGFDLVILQDFNYGPFNTRQHLHRLADYVQGGGALLLVGGELAFSAGGYHETAITEVLPVALPATDIPERSLSAEPFRLLLTEAGRHHPILQLGADRESSAALLESLPPLEGANLFDGTVEGGVVLARHPSLRHRGTARPVIAVREVGKGRSMVFGSDSSWLWAIAHGGAGGDPHVYDRFWNTSLRWLLRDPSLDLVQLRSPNEIRLGEELTATVELRDTDYRPARGASLRLRVLRRPEGAGDTPEEVYTSGAVATDEEGRYTLRWRPERAGIHDIVAQAALPDGPREGRDVVLVSDTDPELATVVPDSPLLERLAELSGGHFASLEEPGEAPALAPPESLQVTERRFEDLWSEPWVLLLALGLLGADWWLRRRWGFL